MPRAVRMVRGGKKAREKRVFCQAMPDRKRYMIRGQPRRRAVWAGGRFRNDQRPSSRNGKSRGKMNAGWIAGRA